MWVVLAVAAAFVVMAAMPSSAAPIGAARRAWAWRPVDPHQPFGPCDYRMSLNASEGEVDVVLAALRADGWAVAYAYAAGAVGPSDWPPEPEAAGRLRLELMAPSTIAPMSVAPNTDGSFGPRRLRVWEAAVRI